MTDVIIKAQIKFGITRSNERLHFSLAQQVEIWQKFNKEAAHFNWLRAKPNEEITRPWLHFKGEPERIEKLTWKYKAKRLALQLFMGIP